MRLLGRYQGRNGAIEIVECSADGTRIYFEEGVRQSQATPDGESVFSYVKLMDELLHRATNILILGCGGGNLATRLARLGKKLTIVDHNPISFVIAQQYFGLPDGLPLVVSNFRKFIFDDNQLYDGIAIDVGGPDFCFDAEFDIETCNAIRARLAPGGCMVMNVLVANDIDPLPDRIAARLAGDRLRAWIIDEEGIQDRNAIIACMSEWQLSARPALAEVMQNSIERWSIRRSRVRGRGVGNPFRR
ncbi:class I SAM-dependent methyltransferase [Bradyrhizobium sp.]|uniref:class I SAM-dependent methyltransferase n=1 Tax=Bradyrhizobium sp. TaxID=376 RepID=UPI002C25FDCA|nr:class I SAM-dependent methyltransferase [Bradyrhizobium sp.]HMM91072.1 class I SAM-dependent methyltransferase [Bradyrhizobium sp.]